MNYFEIRAKRNRIYLARIYATRNVLNVSMKEIIERIPVIREYQRHRR